MDFSVLKDTDLSQVEFAEVLGVSRVTVNLWLHGKANPHRYNTDNVYATLVALRKASDKGLLPTKPAKGRPSRVPKIKEIISGLM